MFFPLPRTKPSNVDAGAEVVEAEAKEEVDEGTGLLPNSGNGYTFGDSGQSWTQTLQDVTFTIPIPEGSKAKDVLVEMKKMHLKVALRSQHPKCIIDEELHKEIQTEDSFWNISK